MQIESYQKEASRRSTYPQITESILRSSPAFRDRMQGTKSLHRVSIAMHIEWKDTDKETKRNIINTVVPLSVINKALCDRGLVVNDRYPERVGRLIESGWTPPEFYLDSYSKLTAEPIEHEGWDEETERERICGFTKTDIAFANTDDLKKWLTFNQVDGPQNGQRADYERVVRDHIGFCTPTKKRWNGLRHKTPSCGSKTVCKTPHRNRFDQNFHDFMSSDSSGDSVEEDLEMETETEHDDGFELPMIEDSEDDHQSVESIDLQMDFDDDDEDEYQTGFAGGLSSLLVFEGI